MTTFPLNVLYGLLCGGYLAACTAPRVVAETVAWSRLMKLPLLFAGLSVVPVAATLAGQFPDWSFMYLVDPQRLPRLWVLAAGLVAGAAVALGFALGMAGYRRYGARPLWVALGGLLFGYLGLGVLGWRSGRLSLVGSFADFHAGGWLMQPVLAWPRSWSALPDARLPRPMPAGLGYALLLANLGVGAALGLVARTLLTKSEFIFSRAPVNAASASAKANDSKAPRAG